MTYRKQLIAATDHLRKSDPVMKTVIQKVGPCTIALDKNYYQTLVTSIVSQQISTKAANTIFGRFMDLLDDQLRPEVVLSFDLEDLRSVGLSIQKSTYILDLSQKFHDNPSIYNHLDSLKDDEAIEYLTQVKGIGEWTAHMFIMFSLGRLDVLPVGDIGFQNALVDHYGFSEKPSKKDMIEVSETWKPYRSIAVWYLWAIYDQD